MNHIYLRQGGLPARQQAPGLPASNVLERSESISVACVRMLPLPDGFSKICFLIIAILLASVGPASSACTLSLSRSCQFSDAAGIFVDNDIAYVATSGAGELVRVSIGGSSLQKTSTWNTANPAYDVFVSGGHAYLTEGSEGVEVVDSSTGTHIGNCASWPSGLFAIGIYASGNYAYVGTSEGYLVVLSLANPDSPSYLKMIATHEPVGSGGGLCVYSNTIYLATDSGVEVYNLGDPSSPSYSTTLSVPGGAYDVHVFEDNAYVAAPYGSSEVQVRSLSNWGTIANCYDYTDNNVPYAIQFYGGKAYIADTGGVKELGLGSGSITVSLDANIETSQTFGFEGDLGNFIMDDNSDGTYSNTKTFNDMQPGSYIIHQIVPSGWTLSSITATDASRILFSSDRGVSDPWHANRNAGDSYAKATVQSGSGLTVTFSDAKLSSISGNVIYDIDGSGTRNNLERYVPNGWKLELYKNGAKIKETTTSNGGYSFSGLEPNLYEVRSILPSGWSNTLPADGRRIYPTLSADQFNQDFGSRGSFTISGMVFHDINGDGIKNGLDSPVSGKTVQLINSTINSAIAECTSGNDGSYQFSNIAPGSYSIKVVATSGWKTTNSPITLTSLTGSVSNQDLGLKGALFISGIKFQDRNANGIYDSGEGPLSTWTIFNDTNLDGVHQAGEIFNVTDSSGIYNLTNLTPGNYRIAEDDKSGWVHTTPAAGYYDVLLTNAGVTGKDFGNIPSLTVAKTTDPSGSTESFTFRDTVSSGDSFVLKDKETKTFLAAPGVFRVTEDPLPGWKLSNIVVAGTASAKYGRGTSFANGSFFDGDTGVEVTIDADEYCLLTFNNSQLFEVSGLVWDDLDYDGIQDAGEPALPGISVELLDGNGNSFSPARKNSTDSEGKYSFAAPSGSYRVKFTLPSGRFFSPKDQGADDSLDSDADPANGLTSTITLSAAAKTSDQDAGMYENKIVINEIYPNPTGNDNTAADASTWERVELKNTGSSDCTVGAWTIRDDDSPFILATIQSGTIIPAGGYLVLHVGGSSTGISNGNGDPVNLNNAAGILVDSVSCPASSSYEGLGYSCLPDATDNWGFWGEPTLGGDLSLSSLPGAPNMGLDWGDAPDSFSTTRSKDGPHHFMTGPFLGTKIDYELNGQPSVSANGDDITGEDDEDGITLPSDIIVGLPSSFNVTASAPGILQAWIDFNGDGDFGDSGEQIASDAALAAGESTISFAVPADAKAGLSYARLRFSTASGLSFTGLASDGEVEDYRIEIKPEYLLGNFVWVDIDGDGLQDANEPGLGGVTVNLRDGADNIVASSATAIDGSYSFANPSPGTYALEFVPPAGYNLTVANVGNDDGIDSDVDPKTHRTGQVTVAFGQSNLTIDAGFYEPASISGSKFNDRNTSGIRDAGEPGLSGWRIYLDLDKDNQWDNVSAPGSAVEPSILTDYAGGYFFSDLAPGSYRIREVAQDGWIQSCPAGDFYDETLVSGQAAVNRDFGNHVLTGISISGKKTNETGAVVKGWNITLTGTTFNGDHFSNRTTTAADGNYSFTGLLAGSYTVAEEAKTGWEAVGPASYTFDLTASKSDVNFVNRVVTGHSIIGKKVNDTGAAKKGWNITLIGTTSDGSAVSLKATTADDGSFRFMGLSSGSYILAEESKLGWQAIGPANYFISFGSKISVIDVTFTNRIVSGLSVSGKKTNETGAALKDWNITIMGTDFDGSAVSRRATTGADGSYSFTGISAGSYTVAEETKAGWQAVGPASYAFDLTASKSDVNFVNRLVSGLSVSGKKTNETGAAVKGWNITLTGTTFSGDHFSNRTTTADDGSYSFTGLLAGSYTVAEEAKAGWQAIGPTSYSFDLLTSKSDVNFVNRGVSGLFVSGKKTNETGAIVKDWNITITGTTIEGTAVSQRIMTGPDGKYNFTGLFAGSYTVAEEAKAGWQAVGPTSYSFDLLASKSDMDFINRLVSGLFVSGKKTNETGAALKDWNITIRGTTFEGSAVSRRATTANDGSYSFTGLFAGSYTVTEETKAGWQAISPASYSFDLTASKSDVNFANSVISGLYISGNKTNETGSAIKGWKITLSGNALGGAAISMNATTANDGSYRFTGLSAGSYTVAEEAKAGWQAVGPTSYSFDLTASKSDVNFINRVISGLYISGKKTNETGSAIKGWNITLSGDTFGGAAVSMNATTADDGSYRFTGLSAGSYTVAEEAKAGWEAVGPTSYSFDLTASKSDVNFINRVISGLYISGKKTNETGSAIKGWNITLSGDTLGGDSVSMNATTADDGSYRFTGLLAGCYTVTEETKAGWEAVGPAGYSFDLTASKADVNFVNHMLSGLFISGKKTNETGSAVKGWNITLYGTTFGGDSVSMNATTADDGSYIFAGLSAGSYTVAEESKAGWEAVGPTNYSFDLTAFKSNLNFINRRVSAAGGIKVNLEIMPQNVLQGDAVTLVITVNDENDSISTSKDDDQITSTRMDILWPATNGSSSIEVTQLLPKGLTFVSAMPSPKMVTKNDNGTTTIIWANRLPYTSPLARIVVQATVDPNASGDLKSSVYAAIMNSKLVIAMGSADAEITILEQTRPVILTKTSDIDKVLEGSYITYTIAYKSLVDIDLTGVVITEHAPSDLEFVSASPSPDGGTDNVWTIGTLAGKASGEIVILYQVKNRANMSYESDSEVTGSGYVNVRRSLSTETNALITNSVSLSCNEFAPISTTYSVKLLEADGTTLLEKEHGSGEYESEELLRLKMQNRSIRTEGSLKASYRPTSFELPGERMVDYDSKLAASSATRNRATSASTSQSLRYAKSIDIDRKLLLDRNETDLDIEAKVQGQAHLGMLKIDGGSQVFESAGDYNGTFALNNSLEDYGKSVRMTGNATGFGLTERDLRLKKSQRSFEHGSGTYRQEEIVSTPESYIAKDVLASYNSSEGYGYGKWTSGIWSKSSGNSLLGQEISGADYIKEETRALGLNEMETNASFSGEGRFRAVSEPDNASAVDLDEQYIGQYTISRKVHLGGVSHFDRPHITLVKEGRPVERSTVIDYRITILNDGNAALGPVYVWDPFPAGTEYVSASIKPTVLKGDSANWTLLYLGIGQTVSIDLRLNITDPMDVLANRVYASGGHNSEWVFASNLSASQVGWLGCCPNALQAEMQARIDSSDSRIIWYRIYLHNSGNTSMAARVTTAIPIGLSFLNASIEPQQFGQSLDWVTDAIYPGEDRIIEYRARALSDGRFASTATVESYPLDGSEGGVSSIATSIVVGNETAATHSEDGWKPPEWGLDRSDIFDSIFDSVAADESDSSSCMSGSCPV